MQIAVFDIETIPAQSLPDKSMPQFDPDTVKIGNLKDPKKIEEKIEIARKAWDQNLVKKMSLDPDLCDVCCFVGMRYSTERNQPGAIVIQHNDPEATKIAWDFIRAAYQDFVPIVTFNGIQFDLPVLLHKAMLTGCHVPAQVYSDLTRRYHIDHHYDLMQILAEWDRSKFKSLDFYLQRFGIGQKNGEGSEVYEMWKAGRRQQIEDYCKHDVEMTARLFSRLEPWITFDPSYEKPF